MITESRLREFLEQSGLEYEALEEDVFAVAFADGDDGQCAFQSDLTTVYMKQDEGGVLLAILPFIPCPRPEATAQLYQKLLTLNLDLIRCAFALDLDGDVALRAWIPEGALSYAEWHQSLGYLVDVALLLRPALG